MTANELAQRANDIAQSAATATWWSAAGTLLTALLTLGLLVGAMLAWRTAKHALDQAKFTQKQMERDSIEQTRPYVYAHIVPGLAGMATWDLVISNTGKSTARKLTISCDRWPDSEDEITIALGKMFATEQSLPPSVTLRTYWKLGLEEGAMWGDGTSDPVGIATGATLTLRYTSDDPSNPPYEDRFRIDDAVIGLTPVPYKGPEPKRGKSKAEEDLHSVLTAIAVNVGEIRR
ncbi:hypothetical protein [Paenarthrobacter sp. PH39-S1]|uniref:hypothetical protein n=1 Tax=Paenarthrobacter sp. PH39-S1 TaxID=3046204 RepID=UPI0024BAF9AF|nr:hypothetical protein [Paenarthrobacter sp. PH39-S1]MDJ0356330.1 hypothetical protein [Paenarthrobacter sp. PH39-S1]